MQTLNMAGAVSTAPALTPDTERLLLQIRTSAGDERLRALRRGAEFFPEDLLVSWLRNDADDVIRNAGLEMLKLRRQRSFAAAVRLLQDTDWDVVLQAVLLLETIGDARAWRNLRPLLTHPDPNVIQAVISSAARVGSRQAASDLLPFLEADLWLQMAAIDALGHLRARVAVPPLARLLSDPDLRQLAAEALARIGGNGAARAVVKFWRKHPAGLEPETWLPLVAEVLVSAERPLGDGALRESLAVFMRSDVSEIATAAATAILALGPGAYDGRAVDVLVDGSSGRELPEALEKRSDLTELLLDTRHPGREWGYELVRRNRRAASAGVLERALLTEPPRDRERFAHVTEVVRNGAVIVRAFLAADDETRAALVPSIRKHRDAILEILGSGDSVRERDRGLLLELAGAPAAVVADTITGLAEEERRAAVAQIRSRAVLTMLPWGEWIQQEGAEYGSLLADLARQFGAREFLPMLREQLAKEVTAATVECVGVLRDRASIPLLIAAIRARAGAATRGHLFESIARVGGRESRLLLREYSTGSDLVDARLAARAIARHPLATDLGFLEELCTHPDWAVRLSVVEAVDRVAHPRCLALLARLASDSSDIVVQKAHVAIERHGGLPS